MEDANLNLIRAAKRGHAEAFATLLQNYRNYVFRIAYGVLQNAADAEDVTQETFLQVYQSLDGLRDVKTFSTWLARIALRKALDAVKYRSRRSTVELNHNQHGEMRDPRELSDARMDLEKALAKLSDEHRIVLILREIEGFPYSDLARILDIPVGTVRSRLHHARLELRSLLSEEGRNPT